MTGCWQTGIWGPSRPIDGRGLQFSGAGIGVRNEKAWRADCDLDVLQDLLWLLWDRAGLERPGGFGTVPAPLDVEPALRTVLTHARRCCDAYDRGGLDPLLNATAAAFEALGGSSGHGTAALFGHAHIDMVWLWPEWVADEKAVHSFATVCRLLERYPEVRFTQSMPAIYRRVEEASPDSLRQIEAARRRGQWEVTGAFEVEPDVNLPCGESLARSIEVGQRLAARVNGGAATGVCWLPDVFGYSRCLPQILHDSGVTRFYTTKMTWSAVTRFPYTSFVWRGPDDTSEVLAHLSGVGYNGMAKLDQHDKALRSHRQAGEHPEMLVGTGLGDGGGGLTERMCERARRQAALAAAPQSRWSRAGDFFDRLESVRDELPKYDGELYLEYHRGTYTTQSEHKRLYRRAERALQAHEAARAAAGLRPLDAADHDRRWRRVLFAQFHDALPGSSIKQVYDELNPQLQAVGDRELSDAAATLGEGRSHVFNPVPMPRVAHVDGRAVRLKPLEARELADDELTPVQATTSTLANGHVRARFDADGRRLAEVPVASALVTLVAGGLLLVQFRPWRRLDALASRVGRYSTDSFVLTLRALLVTLLLAMPIPLALLGGGGLLSTAGGVFAAAVRQRLMAAGAVWLLLGFFRLLCRDGGLADAHFGWDAHARRTLAGNLR